MFSRLYMIIQVHARREEKKATGGDRGKQTRNLLEFNFVKKRKSDEEQDQNDQLKVVIGLRCVSCSRGLPLHFWKLQLI